MFEPMDFSLKELDFGKQSVHQEFTPNFSMQDMKFHVMITRLKHTEEVEGVNITKHLLPENQ
jgi:hypothetical protein